MSTELKSTRVRLLWLDVDNLSFAEAVDRIVGLCRSSRPAYVVTPNVDHYMQVRRDAVLQAIYAKADLVLADGMPVVWASKLLRCPLKAKVSGSDLFEALNKRAAADGLRVFLLGGAPGVAEKAKAAIEARYPGLQIVGTHSPKVAPDGGAEDGEAANARIREAAPDLLFVGFGCPKQEKWMVRNIDRLGPVVCLGVGVSFEFAAGVQRRAPRFLQTTGMEWLWRLAHEPRRLWKRYLINDLPFLFHVIKELVKPRSRRR